MVVTKTFEFLSLKQSIRLELTDERARVQMFIEAFMPLFATRRDENDTWVIELIHSNTASLGNAIRDFVAHWKDYAPRLQGLLSFLGELDPDEHFCFVPMIKIEREFRFDLYLHLRARADGKDFDQVRQEFRAQFGGFLAEYTVHTYGGERYAIGEPVRDRRSCRFCGKSMPDVTFKKKAHAVSEALGNKRLTLYDECDLCNDLFSRAIEPSIVGIFNFHRVFHRVKGKGGHKVLAGDGFKIRNIDGEVSIEITGNIRRPEPGGSEYALDLPSYDQVVAQDVYRGLCKYFLSVIPESELAAFKRTIEWVNRGDPSIKLPLVAVRLNTDWVAEQPLITTYLRLSENSSIPHAVGQFRSTVLTYLFIVPFSIKDNRTFTTDTDYSHFWSTFKHQSQLAGWDFRDLSDSKRRNITWGLRASVRQTADGPA